jgi:hypothetical protein
MEMPKSEGRVTSAKSLSVGKRPHRLPPAEHAVVRFLVFGSARRKQLAFVRRLN